MEITLTDKAIQWFENEYPLDEGEAIRFFGKAYGSTEVHEGFSVGMKMSNPEDFEVSSKMEVNGRTYFTAQEDDWFFNPYDLNIDFDTDAEVPIYHFNK